MEEIKKSLEQASNILIEFINNKSNIEKISKAGNIIINSIKSGGKIISCGNGGSMCDAMHFAEELTGRFRNSRIALPAIAISDPSHISCVANDYGYEYVFSRFIEALGKEGDILFAISTSGNSKNIINAINSAKEKGLKIIGLTGKNGGEIAKIVDIEIRAPYSEYSDRAQEIHIKVIHCLIEFIENHLLI